MADNTTRYTEEEIQIFLDKARKEGIARAIEELKYPSYPTALKWVEKHGISVPAKATAVLASLSNKTLEQEKKIEVANKLYAHYYAAADAEIISDLTLVRLTQGYKTLMETYRVIEGKTEELTEKAASNEDDTFAKMLREFNQTPTK